MRITRPPAAALAAALLLAPVLVGCSSDSGTPAATSTTPAAEPGGNQTAPLPTGGAELADTTWTLSGISSSTEDLGGSGITLEFTASEAWGSGGINTWSASYTSTPDGTLDFGPITSTKMAGNEAAMALETEYFAALDQVTGYSVSGGLLDLFAGADQVMTFTSAG